MSATPNRAGRSSTCCSPHRIEAEVVTDSESIELLPRLWIPVARVGDLIALQVLSRDDVERPQDIVDLRALLRVAAPTDLERARQSITLIAARGYHRGRALLAEFSALLGTDR